MKKNETKNVNEKINAKAAKATPKAAKSTKPAAKVEKKPAAKVEKEPQAPKTTAAPVAKTAKTSKVAAVKPAKAPKTAKVEKPAAKVEKKAKAAKAVVKEIAKRGRKEAGLFHDEVNYIIAKFKRNDGKEVCHYSYLLKSTLDYLTAMGITYRMIGKHGYGFSIPNKKCSAWRKILAYKMPTNKE